MGWLCGDKPLNVKEFLDSRWVEGYTVLKSALKLTEYYAAIQLPNGQVICAIYLLKFYRAGGYHHGGEWCRKDMDEYSGPNANNCPESILKLLSPIDTTQYGHEWAQEWRNRCWAKINKRKATSNLTAGMVVQYGNQKYSLKRKLKTGAWEVFDSNGYGPYRMKRSQLEKAEVFICQT